MLEVISSPEQPGPASKRAGGATREAELVPRITWRWRTGWWEVDGRRFSAAAAPSSPLHEGAGTNPEVTLSFLSAHRSPHGAEICTRKSSGQRAGSVPAAELQPLLPISKENVPGCSPGAPPARPAGRDLSCTRDARRNHARRDAVTVTLCLHAGEKSARCRSPGLCVTGAGWGVHHPLS